MNTEVLKTDRFWSPKSAIALLAIVFSWQLTFGSDSKGYPKGEMLFALEVKPILANKCFSCHGDDPEEIEGGLDMTTREGLLKGRVLR